jgi:molybdate/tungstate transport system substrate-binding protein
MPRSTRPAGAPAAAFAAFAAISLVAAACSSSTKAAAPPTSLAPAAPAATPTTPATATGHGTGPVDVLYAGSLVTVMNKTIGPAFQTATGYTFSGVSGDSGALANQIKAKTAQGDVFISANPSKDQALEGAANGNWVSWYAQFATSNLVLGYNPHGKFAAQLETQPWYKVITQTGFLLGRTDPATDPKGALTVSALDDAAVTDGAGTKAIAASSANVFPENTLVGRLQAGQLDAGFFYSVEAASAGIQTVPLAGIPTLQAKYTITVLGQAPHEAGAVSFVQFLLGTTGAADLAADGLTVSRPLQTSGAPPSDVQAVLSGQ